MNRKNELLVRVYAVMLLFVVIAIVMSWRLFQISMIEGEKWREKGDRKYLKWETIEGERGDVLAEDGSLLLTSNQFFEIRMDPVSSMSDVLFNSKIDSLAYCLAKYSDIQKSRKAWKDLLVSNRRAYTLKNSKSKGSRYIKIADDLDFDRYKQFKKFPLLRKGTSGGMITIPTIKRDRPYGALASRTLGMDRENANKIGLEAAYDEQLSGDSLTLLMRKLQGNRWVPIVDMEDIDTEKGNDIQTTLDIELCDIVHTALMRGVEKSNARAGTAILMEVETGAIKAMTSLKKLKSGKFGEVYNYAIAESGEPGSTFKAASALAMIEDGVDINTMVDLEGGKAKFHDLWMRDSERHGERVKTFRYSFMKSSNVGMAKLAREQFGTKEKAARFISYLENFGLTEKVGIDIPGESAPYIKHPKKNPEKWYGTTIPWMAHGYELELSPIQTVAFYNAIANGGRLMKPYLVSGILKDGEQIKEYGPKTINEHIASAESIGIMQGLLEDVVHEGTARKLKTSAYDFAGKTGTASINYNSQDGTEKRHNASFAGYFPAQNPKYSLIVMVYEPEGAYYGGSVAGPVFREIADNIHIVKSELNDPVIEDDDVEFESLAVKNPGYANDLKELLNYVDIDYRLDSKSNWITAEKKNDIVVMTKKNFVKDVVPDVRGMGLRDAMYALENMGLDVEPHGVGKVYKQTLLPGTTLSGQAIKLYLN